MVLVAFRAHQKWWGNIGLRFCVHLRSDILGDWHQGFTVNPWISRLVEGQDPDPVTKKHLCFRIQ